jgi:hypothetical protein
VKDLRVHPGAEAELEWFFNQAESDMGARSNFEIMVRSARAVDPEEAAAEAAEAAHKHRRIRTWLRRMPDRQAGILQAAYETGRWPRALRDELGVLIGIVARLACAQGPSHLDRGRQAIVEERWAELHAEGGAESGAAAALQALREEAERLLVTAHVAYRLARGRGPWLVRGS